MAVRVPQMASRRGLRMLSCRKANLQLFGAVGNKAPWESVLVGRVRSRAGSSLGKLSIPRKGRKETGVAAAAQAKQRKLGASISAGAQLELRGRKRRVGGNGGAAQRGRLSLLEAALCAPCPPAASPNHRAAALQVARGAACARCQRRVPAGGGNSPIPARIAMGPRTCRRGRPRAACTCPGRGDLLDPGGGEGWVQRTGMGVQSEGPLLSRPPALGHATPGPGEHRAQSPPGGAVQGQKRSSASYLGTAQVIGGWAPSGGR